MSLASWMARVAVIVTGAISAVGCSPATPSAYVGFAVPSTTLAGGRSIETHGVRVLASAIDLRQPVFVQRNGDAIDVTYAVRQRDGVTVRLDARTLRDLDEPSPYVYPRCSAREVSVHLSRDIAKVTVDSGDEVAVFTSEERRAFARVNDGAAVAVSPEGMAIVGPGRASTNGKDVVAVFVAATKGGFALVAASLEVGAQAQAQAQAQR